MKSTIKVDFQGPNTTEPHGFEPIIRVAIDCKSDDVRDGLLRSFFQALGGESSWLRVEFDDIRVMLDEGKKYLTITPVKWHELDKELKVLKERVEGITDILK